MELATAGYANTGLMLLTERAVARLAISGSDAPIYLGPRYEQDYVNATFQKEDFKISPLSALVNCIVEITPFLKDTAFILHFAGASNANSDRSVFVETIEPQSSRYIRAKSNLGNIFLRLLLLRNAIYAEFRPVDILLAAHQFATPHGQLVATGNVTRVDCSNTPGCVVFGPYITLEAGYYLIDILLDLQSYQSAFSSTAQRDLDCVEGSVAVDIVSNLGLRTIVEKKIQAFSCSSLSIGFRLNERTEQVECRLSEPSRPFSFYGMRIRSVDKHQRNEMVDIDLADPRSAAAICKQALGFRLADLQAVRRHCLPRPLIVTLTSHRRRFPGLASALKCLLSQSMRPDQVVLWLAPSDHKDLPNEVLELQTRGLTINSTEDIGPYTKIVPAFLAYPDAFIICADDDKYYPRDWLAELVDAWIPDERVLLCHRAHRMRFDAAGSLLPYVQWEWEIDAPETGSDLFATGCGGILFTPGLIPADAWDQEVFLRICATANDVWINCMAIKFGCLIRKVGGLFRVPDLPDTQEVGRAHRNLGGANDDQMRAVLQHYRIELHKGLH